MKEKLTVFVFSRAHLWLQRCSRSDWLVQCGKHYEHYLWFMWWFRMKSGVGGGGGGIVGGLSRGFISCCTVCSCRSSDTAALCSTPCCSWCRYWQCSTCASLTPLLLRPSPIRPPQTPCKPFPLPIGHLPLLYHDCHFLVQELLPVR